MNQSMSFQAGSQALGNPSEEMGELRRVLRDVAALSALPSIWVESDINLSLQNLTDVARASLRCLTVCIRAELFDGTRIAAGSETGLGGAGVTQETAALLDAVEAGGEGLVEIPRFNGSGPVKVLVEPIFSEGRRVGCFAACYSSSASPGENERVVLQVAASQAGLLFQRYKEEDARSARRRAEDRLRQTEHRYQQLVQLLPAAVYTCDSQGRITFYNPRAAELWGREPRLGDLDQRFCGAYRLWRLDGSLLPHEEIPMARAIRQGISIRNGEVIIERPDGSRAIVSVNIDPLYDAEGNRCGAVNVFQDITKKKETEKELQRRTHQLSSFLETAALGLHRVGPDGAILWANAAELEMLGYSSEEYIGQPIAKFHADAAIIQEILARLARGEKLHDFPARLRCKDGSIKQVLIDSNGYWEDGKFVHSQCFTRDITRQRAMEQELRDSEARFRGLVNSVEGIVWECAIEAGAFRFTFVSKQAERLLGYPLEQWLAEPDFWPKHIHPDDRDWAVNYCVSATGQHQDHDFEYRMVAANGRAVWLRDMVTVVMANGQPVKLVGVMVDITQRKQAEEALRQSEAVFRQLADAMPQIVWAARSDGQADYYNRRWQELTGPAGDANWVSILHPDDRKKSLEAWAESVRTGKDYQVEYRFKFPPNSEYRWYLARALPLRNLRGEIIRWFGTCTDIDDQKRAEKKLEEAVAERTASLKEALAQMEEFSYSVSHDLRAPLRAMQGYCHILIEEAAAELNAENLGYLQRISQSAERLDRLVQDVLAYARVNRIDVEMKPVNLEHLISDVLRSYTGEHLPLPEINVQRPLASVLGHEPSLVQCLSNLLGNAIKFTSPGQAAQVRIWTERVQDQVRLWIEDKGIGIRPDQQDRIFKIFERSPEASPYPGTGVGLAVVKKAIHRMQGEVGVQSEPGQGSRFWIQLPCPIESENHDLHRPDPAYRGQSG